MSNYIAQIFADNLSDSAT